MRSLLAASSLSFFLLCACGGDDGTSESTSASDGDGSASATGTDGGTGAATTGSGPTTGSGGGSTGSDPTAGATTGASGTSAGTGSGSQTTSGGTTDDGTGTGDTGGATVIDISIAGFAFGPENQTVSVGTTVRWTNDDSTDHTVTSDGGGGPLDSANLPPGGTYEHTFDTVGSFPYHCTIHPSMMGSITVE